MGSQPSVADFELFEHIQYTNQLTDQTYEYYPYLKAFNDRISNQANMKKYLSGPHHAKIKDNWLPTSVKINLATVGKCRVPPKLHYFELDGRAGAIRMLLGHANVNYTDARKTPEAFGAMKA